MNEKTREFFEFIDLERNEPAKYLPNERKISFKEIYEPFETEQAKSQASRCLDCGNPYCQWKCPVHNHIPVWLQLASEGKIIEAAELAHETNSLPEVCGRVCPQDRLCEGACTLNTDFGAVTIGQVEKYIIDQAFAQGWQPDLSEVDITDYRVAIVGAGPAGLACADVLIRSGIKAVVFDSYPEIGGLLTFGIPEFKLEKEVIKKRRQIFESMGIEFQLNTKVGEDISFATLYEEYDAIFLGMGTYKSMPANLPGQDVEGVFEALPYLVGNTNHIHGHDTEKYPYINLKDKNVVVLGGGDTAMDCVRTAIRQGARTVKCVYRRDEMSMPGSRREVANAKEEGVEFIFNRQPIAIEQSGGKLHSVSCAHTYLETVDGRQVLKQGNECESFQADAVIIAFGFLPNPPAWFDDFSIAVTEKDRVDVSFDGARSFQTSNPKIFAGGDMVRGADLVVTAIAEGRQAAESMIEYLSEKN